MTSLAAWLLTACGVALILIGGFFVALRPPLLPEDARFMGAPADAILGAIPGLGTWLRRVFWVLGATSPRRECWSSTSPVPGCAPAASGHSR